MVTLLEDSNIEIIRRDSDLKDDGEVTKFLSWKSTHKLNQISVWQIDTQKKLFDKMPLEPGQHGIMFKREGETLLTGPVIDVQHSLSGGEEKTSIFGCDDMYWLGEMDSFPVVIGPNLEADGNWYFSVKRNGNGLWSTTTSVTTAPITTDTQIILAVGSVIGYVVGASVAALNPTDQLGTITALDETKNELTVLLDLDPATGDPLFMSELEQDATVMQTITGTDILVDNPDYKGYDTRKGKAESVVKQLVYYNAADGACTDSYGSRAVPHLHIAADKGRGSEITVNARGEKLLSLVADGCRSGGLNFDVMQDGTDLLFDVYAGADLSADDKLIFSRDRGNLKDYNYKYGMPVANFVIGYGKGAGAKKLVYPSGIAENIAQYGRHEGWVSASTSDAGATPADVTANMIQTNNTFLRQSSQNVNITVTLQETAQIRFPTDFRVGDIVPVYIGDKKFKVPVTAVIYEVPGTSSASGSALSAALTMQETRQMNIIRKHGNEIEKLIKS